MTFYIQKRWYSQKTKREICNTPPKAFKSAEEAVTWAKKDMGQIVARYINEDLSATFIYRKDHYWYYLIGPVGSEEVLLDSIGVTVDDSEWPTSDFIRAFQLKEHEIKRLPDYHANERPRECHCLYCEISWEVMMKDIDRQEKLRLMRAKQCRELQENS